MADEHPRTDRRRPEQSLRAAGVSRSFEGVQALSEVTLELGRDEVIGLIGPNGAGKTTMINLLSGFDRPTGGSVLLDGHDVTRWSAVRRAHAGLGRTFQHGHLFGGLSVRENVEVAALGTGASPRESRKRASELLSILGIGDRAQAPAAILPHGEERKVGVARALASRPRYLLMDEPAAGLPESESHAFADVIRTVREQYGAGVLVIDHNMTLIMAVCDRIVVLDQGRVIAEGAPDQIRNDIDVAAAYLGGSMTVAADA
jgi:branched-chain amino acid transport system ATP-binding protein